MIVSKHLTKIVALLVCVCLVFCGFIVYAANAFDTTHITEYQKRLFNGEIISLDIQVDQDEWQAMMKNAQAKEWISADIIINGERFNTVGIRTKGNSSLGSSSDNRYSLSFKLNKYVKGQTYYGLDSFCINNVLGDATYMKDYLSYEIMNFIGVDSPLTNFASVTVNGEDYGFCLALERYDKAFLDRVYSTSSGQLYSVKIGMGMRGDFEDMFQDVENAFPGRQQGDAAQGGFNFGDRQQGGGMGMGGGMGGRGGGGSLIYTDDNISSYSSIFNNAVFSSASDKDKQRVITAIENLNNGTDLEKYLDVDQILRYFAAHTVVVNLDSYTTNMEQNYYIYERDGKITILPWDYGLAFGGFQSGSASSVVNFPIDTPVSGVSMENRPLINKLLEVPEYLEKYHEYLLQIVEGYFESGLYENTINTLDAKISEYVKNDFSAFYTYDQYKASLPNLIELGNLRAESIRGQLEGTVPSTSAGQNANPSALIDASTVNLSALGSMMGGGGMGQGGRPDGMDGFNGQGGFNGGGMFDRELMQQAMQMISDAGGELTDEIREALLELGIPEEQIEMFANTQNGFPGGNMGQGGRQNQNQNQDPNQQGAMPGGNNNGGGQGNPPSGNNSQQGNMPSGNGFNSPSGTISQSSIGTEYIVIVCILLVFLIAATVFIARPRKNMV